MVKIIGAFLFYNRIYDLTKKVWIAIIEYQDKY